MKKNEGYTLIEMIIVIAIIAILAGASFVTLGIINQARCSAATSTLSDEMGALLVKTKAISEAKKTSAGALCMKLEYNDTAKQVGSVYVKKGSYSVFLGYYDGSTFTYRPDANTLEATIPKLVTIEYAPDSPDQKPAAIAGFGEKDILIQYDKATGAVRYGAGTYTIKCNDKKYATVYLDKATGNHYTK